MPAVLYCTVLYCTVLYCTVLCCTVLCCAVLHRSDYNSMNVCAGRRHRQQTGAAITIMHVLTSSRAAAHREESSSTTSSSPTITRHGGSACNRTAVTPAVNGRRRSARPPPGPMWRNLSLRFRHIGRATSGVPHRGGHIGGVTSAHRGWPHWNILFLTKNEYCAQIRSNDGGRRRWRKFAFDGSRTRGRRRTSSCY